MGSRWPLLDTETLLWAVCGGVVGRSPPHCCGRQGIAAFLSQPNTIVGIAVGSSPPHCRGQGAVGLCLKTTTPQGGSGQRGSYCTVPHRRGQWAVGLLQYTVSLHRTAIHRTTKQWAVGMV